MTIDGQIRRAIEEQDQELKQKEKKELEELIELSREYASMLETPGWKRLYKEITERCNALSGRLLTVDSEKALFRIQGELLGLQSVLNIIDLASETAKEAQQELEGV